MPDTLDQLKRVFIFMINEGVIMSFSLLLNRIKVDPKSACNSVILTNILWILEDFSAGDTQEVAAIIDDGIVARVF